jgi:hypothetical protein
MQQLILLPNEVEAAPARPEAPRWVGMNPNHIPPVAMLLNPLVPYWRQTVPANPLLGFSGPAVERERSDYPFYCDACQRGFLHQQLYDAHMEQHIFCTVPGCGFTCRRDKAWKMDLHVETLHNRPDAPDLADPKSYIAARRSRFPTTENVAAAVEALTYKAACGEVLPDERRRWLRHHGVIVRRDGGLATAAMAFAGGDSALARDAAEFEAREAERRHRREQRQQAADEAAAAAAAASASSISSKPRVLIEDHPTADGAADGAADGEENDGRRRRIPVVLRRQLPIIPMGANGRLTQRQQVELIRERYHTSALVPSFYVCNRCGAKGAHWIEGCPLVTAAAAERSRKEREEAAAATSAAPAAEPATVAAAEGEDGQPNVEPVEGAAAAAGAETCVEEGPQAGQRRSRSPTSAAVAGGAPPSAVARPAAAAVPPRRRAPPQRQLPPPPPTLLQRMMMDNDATERGLLLQALRYFVANDFLQPRGASAAAPSLVDGAPPSAEVTQAADGVAVEELTLTEASA